MTRGLDSGNVDLITADHVPYIFFVQLDFSQPLRVCSAGYNMQWNGETWLGLGALGSIEPIQEQANLEATGVRLSLTGVPTEYVAVMLAEQYQGNPCRIWFAPLRWDLQLGYAPIPLFSGRMDVPAIDVGDTASISVSAESRMVAWDRAKVRRFNNEDQQSRYPGDRGFEFVPQMVEMQLLWGR